MIQESINQLLTTAGIAARFSPIYEARLEGKAITKKAEQAQAGFSEISKNLENPEKNYTAIELDDIENGRYLVSDGVSSFIAYGEPNKYSVNKKV